jgi:hypothetical protein
MADPTNDLRDFWRWMHRFRDPAKFDAWERKEREAEENRRYVPTRRADA